jgi:predicted dehydrogenase
MNGTVKIAVIGVGYWGPNLIRTFSELDESEVVFACDMNSPRLEYVNHRWPAVKTTNDYEEMLNDESIEAIAIATPLQTHFEIAESCLRAGKHVFIEKPMVCSSDQAMRLVDLAEIRGLKIGTGHIFVYHPAVVEMKEVLFRNKIGARFYAHSIRMNPAPSHATVDVIWDLAVHDASIALYLFGHEPTHVRASGGAFAHGERADVATIELYFPDGTLSYHHVGWLTSAKERLFFVAGETGSMTFDDTKDQKLRIVGPAVDTRADAGAQSGHIFYAPGEVEAIQLSNAEPLKSECEDFVQAVLNEKTMVSNGLFGHSVVKILEAASASISNEAKIVALEEKVRQNVF